MNTFFFCICFLWKKTKGTGELRDSILLPMNLGHLESIKDDTFPLELNFSPFSPAPLQVFYTIYDY